MEPRDAAHGPGADDPRGTPPRQGADEPPRPARTDGPPPPRNRWSAAAGILFAPSLAAVALLVALMPRRPAMPPDLVLALGRAGLVGIPVAAALALLGEALGPRRGRGPGRLVLAACVGLGIAWALTQR